LRETPDSVQGLLRISRNQVELFETIQRKLVQELRSNPELAERVERRMSIDGVGEIWRRCGVLEIGEVNRLSSSIASSSTTVGKDPSGRGPNARKAHLVSNPLIKGDESPEKQEKNRRNLLQQLKLENITPSWKQAYIR
jgi:hypothetical protein